MVKKASVKRDASRVSIKQLLTPIPRCPKCDKRMVTPLSDGGFFCELCVFYFVKEDDDAGT